MAVWLCCVFRCILWSVIVSKSILWVSFFYDFELLLTSTAISYFTQAFAFPFPVLFGILIAQFTSAPHLSRPPEAQPVLVSGLWIRHLKCFQWRPRSILSPGPSGLYKRFWGLPGANWEYSLICTLSVSSQNSEGDTQTLTEVDLFISTQRIKVLNADTQVLYAKSCFSKWLSRNR